MMKESITRNQFAGEGPHEPKQLHFKKMEIASKADMIVRERSLKDTADYLSKNEYVADDDQQQFAKLKQLDTSGKFALSSDNEIQTKTHAQA